MGVFVDGVLLDSALMPWLPAVMKRVLRLGARKQDEDMWTFTYHMLLSKFKLACHELGLTDPSLYRLRQGGASHDAAARLRGIAEIKRRGRWAKDNSVRRYEKRTWLQATEAKVSRTMALAAEVLERELPRRLLAWKMA